METNTDTKGRTPEGTNPALNMNDAVEEPIGVYDGDPLDNPFNPEAVIDDFPMC